MINALPSQVLSQVSVVIQREADQGDRHKVHHKGQHPEDPIADSSGKASHLPVAVLCLIFSSGGLHLFHIILLQVIDAFAWWQC